MAFRKPRYVTPAHEIVAAIEGGNHTLVAVPFPTRAQPTSKRTMRGVYARSLHNPITQRMLRYLASEAVVHHIIEVEGLSAVTVKDIEHWLYKNVHPKSAVFANDVAHWVYTRLAGKRFTEGTRADRRWGTSIGRKCVKNYGRTHKDPILGLVAPIRVCWRDAWRVPVLAPMLRYLLDKRNMAMLGVPPLYIVLANYALQRQSMTMPIIRPRVEDAKSWFTKTQWEYFVQVIRGPWFVNKMLTPSEDAITYIDALAVALNEQPQYWR